MKLTPTKGLFACLAAGAAMTVGQMAAYGAILVSDSFTYADGALEGKVPSIGGAWAPHSGDGTNDVQVVSGQARLNQPGSGEDIHTDFAGGAIGAGTTVYAAFDLTVADPGVSPITPVYFAHFSNGATFFSSRIFMAPPTTAGYKVGLSGNATLDQTWGTDLAFGSTYRIVSSYNFDTGEQKLWVNPSVITDPSLTATLGIFSGNAHQNYSLRQSTANTVQLIDNLCVATNFTEAVTCRPIPEPAAAALAGLALTAGMVARRRYAC